jgi:hypothetical protein
LFRLVSSSSCPSSPQLPPSLPLHLLSPLLLALLSGLKFQLTYDSVHRSPPIGTSTCVSFLLLLLLLLPPLRFNLLHFAGSSSSHVSDLGATFSRLRRCRRDSQSMPFLPFPPFLPSLFFPPSPFSLYVIRRAHLSLLCSFGRSTSNTSIVRKTGSASAPFLSLPLPHH